MVESKSPKSQILPVHISYHNSMHFPNISLLFSDIDFLSAGIAWKRFEILFKNKKTDKGWSAKFSIIHSKGKILIYVRNNSLHIKKLMKPENNA